MPVVFITSLTFYTTILYYIYRKDEYMEFNRSKYIAQYKKEHYKRKEIMFKEDEWKEVEKKLKEKNTTLKQVVLDFVNKK